MVAFEDISHLAMEVTDLAEAERFYTRAFGMEVLLRDAGESGRGRIVLQAGQGHVLFLEKADELSARARFCGPDPKNVPDPDGGFRYKGAHLAMSVGSSEEYDDVYARLEPNGAYLEGDLRAGERAPGEKSTYFYDPFGNRFQLIIVPLPGGA